MILGEVEYTVWRRDDDGVAVSEGTPGASPVSGLEQVGSGVGWDMGRQGLGCCRGRETGREAWELRLVGQKRGNDSVAVPEGTLGALPVSVLEQVSTGFGVTVEGREGGQEKGQGVQGRAGQMVGRGDVHGTAVPEGHAGRVSVSGQAGIRLGWGGKVCAVLSGGQGCAG